MYHRLMRSYQLTAFTLLDKCNIFYGGHKSGSGVGSKRWRRFYIDTD